MSTHTVSSKLDEKTHYAVWVISSCTLYTNIFPTSQEISMHVSKMVCFKEIQKMLFFYTYFLILFDLKQKKNNYICFEYIFSCLYPVLLFIVLSMPTKYFKYMQGINFGHILSLKLLAQGCRSGHVTSSWTGHTLFVHV